MAGFERPHKRRRRHRHSHAEFSNSRHAIPDAMDLFVPIPSSSSNSSSNNNSSNNNNKRIMDTLWSRLFYTGVRHVALTHVVHLGTTTTAATSLLRDPQDRAKVAIPDSLIPTQHPHEMTVYRRLHMIVPPTMDDTTAAQIIRSFSHQLLGPPDLLAEYDLVSLAVVGHNNHDAVLTAACSCQDIDIVTLSSSLDTTAAAAAATMIRSAQVRAIWWRHAVLEIPYAQPLLMNKARKVWIQQCRILMTAAAKSGSSSSSSSAEKPILKIPLLISSGHRSTTTGSSSTTDVGSVALRTPSDISNVGTTILGFDPITAVQAVTTAGRVALEHGRARRQRQLLLLRPSSDPTTTTTVRVVGTNLENPWRRRRCSESRGGTPPPPQRNPTDPTTTTAVVVTRREETVEDDNGDDDDDDDFIAL